MKVFYLTSTGNSLHVARQLSDEPISIAQALKEGLDRVEEDEIGIVYPCYGVGTPKMVLKFIQEVELVSPYIFAVMTYGMIAGASAHHLTKAIEARGLHLSYFRQIKMVDNYLPNFNMDKERALIPKKNIPWQIERVVRDMEERNHRIHRNTGVEKIFTRLYQKHHNNMLSKAHKKMLLKGECSGCSICVKVCSSGNIVLENGRPVFGENCQFCLACAHHCSKKIIRIKGEKGHSRFIHQDISLKDIVGANNQLP